MYYGQNLLIMTQITMSIRKPAGAIFLALALITTTFAGISSADHLPDEESNTVLWMIDELHAYVEYYDDGNATGNVSANLYIYHNMSDFNVTYSPEILSVDSSGIHWVSFNLTSLFEGNSSTAPTFEEGTCYNVDAEIYEYFEDGGRIFLGSNHMQISMDNGSACEDVEEMFICDNGEEIPMSWYDDGMADCEDGSDEPNGTGDNTGEVEYTFNCGSGDEISLEWVNDGEEDCDDGSDEQQYDVDGNEINWFECSDGSEIWIHQVNDGYDDCPYNGGDELYDTGNEEDEEEIEFVSHDMDIWFEQWDDESMEFVMVNRMVIDDSEAIALYAMMADMYLGNNDGEVSQDEVDSFIEMMNEETDDEGVNEAMMQLDGAPGTMVDTWMEIEGLVGIDESNVNESEIVMIMVEVVAFDTTAYADSTTHVFTIDDDDDSSEEPVPDEGCDIDSIWIHNSDTWSVSSITDSASTMAFTYEDFNNAWFTEDCPDDSGIVTFNLVKTDGGELPDATEDNDWEDLDTNRFPICAYAYAVMLPNGEFDVRVGIGAAPESGDYIIDLVDGAKYMISVVCSDPEGEDMTVTINNADLNLTSTYTSTATAEASLLLSVPAGYDGTYVFDVTWTDGYHVESGNLTIIGLGDGSNDDDISADGDGFLPGFTAALGIVALLGAAMIGSRRNRA